MGVNYSSFGENEYQTNNRTENLSYSLRRPQLERSLGIKLTPSSTPAGVSC